MTKPITFPDLEKSLIINEYKSLREEILSRLSKISRLQEGLLLGTLLYVATILQRGSQSTHPTAFLFYLFLLILPLIAFVIELICTSEQDAVFRAGIYIRDNIEKQYRSSIFHGWEDWLERLDKVQRRRTSDNLIKFARRFIIIPLYCLASSVMGVFGLKEFYVLSLQTHIIGAIIIFLFCVYIMLFMLMIRKISIAQGQEFSSPFYNIFVIDIDGCLMDSQRLISDLNKEALNSLAREGVNIILATGRSCFSLEDVCNEINHSGFHVASHGASIYNSKNKQEILQHHLTGKSVIEVIKQINVYGFKWAIFGTANIYCKDTYFEEVRQQLIARKDLPTDKNFILKGIADELSYDWPDDISKILIYINFSDNVKVNDLTKILSNSYKIIKSTPETLEVLNKKASKVDAVERIIKEKYGLTDTRSLVVGDYDSDIEILNWADQAVASSNASIEVRKLKNIDVLEISNDENLIWAISRIHFNYK